jgi:hypothetical protein
MELFLLAKDLQWHKDKHGISKIHEGKQDISVNEQNKKGRRPY